jgi:hypothetical protein
MDALVERLNAAGTWFVGFGLPMLIQSSLLIAVLLGLDLLLRKRVRAVVRYGLLMLILVKLVLPVGLAVPTGVGYWLGDALGGSQPVTLAPPAPLAPNPERPIGDTPFVPSPVTHAVALTWPAAALANGDKGMQERGGFPCPPRSIDNKMSCSPATGGKEPTHAS